MRLKVAVALVVLMALAPGSRAADQQIVAQTNSATFTPSEVTVNVGEKVTVTRAAGGALEHNARYDDQASGCPAIPTTSGWACERTFPAAGNYRLFCEAHPSMTATVHVVTSGPTPGPGPGPTPTVPATPGPTPGTTSAPKTVPLRQLARIPKGCAPRRSYRIRLRNTKLLSSARVFVNGKRAATLKGAKLASRIKLRGLPKRRFTLKVEVTRTDGSRLAGKRRVRVCSRR